MFSSPHQYHRFDPHPHPRAPIRASVPKTVFLFAIVLSASYATYNYTFHTFIPRLKSKYYDYKVDYYLDKLGIEKVEPPEGCEIWNKRYRAKEQRRSKMESLGAFVGSGEKHDAAPRGIASDRIQQRMRETRVAQEEDETWKLLDKYIALKKDIHVSALARELEKFNYAKLVYIRTLNLSGRCMEGRDKVIEERKQYITWPFWKRVEIARFYVCRAFQQMAVGVLSSMDKIMERIAYQEYEYNKLQAMHYNCNGNRLKDLEHVYAAVQMDEL